MFLNWDNWCAYTFCLKQAHVVLCADVKYRTGKTKHCFAFLLKNRKYIKMFSERRIIPWINSKAVRHLCHELMFVEYLQSSRWWRGNKLGYLKDKRLSLWELTKERRMEWFPERYLPAEGEIKAWDNPERNIKFYLI